MVTDSVPVWSIGGGAERGSASTRDQHVAMQTEQIAQYWQRCYQQSDLKLSRSLSATHTLASDEDEAEDEDVDDEDEDEDDSDVDDESNAYEQDEDDISDYECRYVHYRRRSSRGTAFVSGLPLQCGNCGNHFFSLRSVDDEDDCFCSGECKWSVIMHEEMNRRMFALRTRSRPSHSTAYAQGSGYASPPTRRPYTVDKVVSCH